jgi:hypothetical protein
MDFLAGPTVTVVTWTPCCRWSVEGLQRPGAMHNGMCRGRPGHNGELGPTVRLVVHAEDREELEEYLATHPELGELLADVGVL